MGLSVVRLRRWPPLLHPHSKSLFRDFKLVGRAPHANDYKLERVHRSDAYEREHLAIGALRWGIRRFVAADEEGLLGCAAGQRASLPQREQEAGKREPELGLGNCVVRL